MSVHFPDKTDLNLRALLGAFGVKDRMVHQPLHELSGGQHVRVVFAKICADRPHLLILDEPTNHLDIYSADALTEALQAFKGAVILVTHNRSVLNEVAKELYHMSDGQCRRVALPPDGDLGNCLMPKLLNATPATGVIASQKTQKE